MRPARALERIDTLIGAGRQIEPQNRMRVDVVRPHLAVHMRLTWHHHGLLGGVGIELGRQRIMMERLGMGVELHDPTLEHHGKPPVPIVVRLERQSPGRKIRLGQGVGKFRMGAGTRIKPAKKGLDEI